MPVTVAARIRRQLAGTSQPSVDPPTPSSGLESRPGSEPARRISIERLRRQIGHLGRKEAIPVAGQRFSLDPLDPPRRARGELARQATDASQMVYQTRVGAERRLGPAATTAPDAALFSRICALLRLELAADPRADTSPAELSDLRPEHLLFIDTETTGLSRGAGTIPFMIAVGGFFGPGSTFQVDQIVVHDPAREAEALALLRGYLARTRVLVSFNGRSFDLPLLRTRCVLNRIRLELDRPHLDLLPICRRFFGGRLSSCRLCCVERELLGFLRENDLDGAEACRVYNGYLRSGCFAEMERLLEHNLLDVAVLAVLLARVANHAIDPLGWAEDGEELLASGLYHLRRGSPDLGEACMQRALELTTAPNTRLQLLTSLARHHRRAGRWQAAQGLWQRYCEEFPRSNIGWIELAKLQEHQGKNLARALALAESAPDPTEAEMQHRVLRLRRRLANRSARGSHAGESAYR